MHITQERTLSPLFLGLLAAAALCGCYLEHDPYDGHHGTATLGWSIAGGRDPAACAANDATFVRVVISMDRDGAFSDFASCTRFASRYVLERGWYTATLTLLDASFVPVAGPRETGSFYVSRDVEATVSVDFTPRVPQ